ncbi:hypothetical protein [Clostridium botulinum]|uniref:hypothetical protein n=1 Tax=Clostridium botulinum TaxID=1491 RepID=UPI00196849A0|nr:hypothetical protein [Clostridium botulinum]
MNNDDNFCTCSRSEGITSGYEDDWGFWDVCVSCGKKIEDGYHYYNHYDGEDHDDIDME